MKLEITRTTKQKEMVEIELPYYYKHDLMIEEADVVTYGKVEESRCTSIKITHNYGSYSQAFDLSIEDMPAAAYGSYMTDEYKGDEAEYLAAKAKLMKAAEYA